MELDKKASKNIIERKKMTETQKSYDEAMKQVAETGQGPQTQIPSMGCSIKWK